MRIELRIPTCAASAADMIDIPAGPFLYGGAGRPAVQNADCVLPEVEGELPAFAIDRTEVSNARFASFAAMSAITGYPMPDYPRTELHAHAGEPQMPLASIDAFEAEAFCNYLGKRLPRDTEWVKAARGGLMIDGAPNPEPRRLYPWGTADRRECRNDAGPEDGHAWVAAVDDLTCGASPYGVLNLVGNVAEWISQAEPLDRERGRCGCCAAAASRRRPSSSYRPPPAATSGKGGSSTSRSACAAPAGVGSHDPAHATTAR
jgi:iron(II)-dependent oxidoreductase